MPYLVAAVVLVGAIATLNLLLMVGVIRRLREHTERLAGMRAAGGVEAQVDLMRPAGERPEGFAAQTVDGQEVTLESLQRPALVGFFSPSCQPCEEWIPRFAAAAGVLPGGRFQALAVIAAGGSAAAAEESDKVEQLRPTAQVVVEPPDGPVTRAFAVKGWPALCRLGEDGTIETTDSQAVVAIPAAA